MQLTRQCRRAHFAHNGEPAVALLSLHFRALTRMCSGQAHAFFESVHQRTEMLGMQMGTLQDSLSNLNDCLQSELCALAEPKAPPAPALGRGAPPR